MKRDRVSHRQVVSGQRRGHGPHISLDRRIHARRPAVDYRIWVGGWASGREFTTIAARVENISRGGLRIVAPLAFAEGEDVWLRLGCPEHDGCLRAEVLQVLAAESGDHCMRLRFEAECPDSFFEIVTEGLESARFDDTL